MFLKKIFGQAWLGTKSNAKWPEKNFVGGVLVYDMAH